MYKFVWGDGKVVLEPGAKKNFHHFKLMQRLVEQIGHSPVRYIAGAYTPDPHHPQFSNISINWSNGANLPTPEELKIIIQAALIDNV